MGLDLAMGGLLLLMALRGWFKGFALQAIHLGGLVSCVYAADPVRNLVKPRILPYLPSIYPDLMDRGLWWASAVVCYIVLVGLATLALKLSRRQPFGMEEEANRNDQIGGAMLGIAKGLVVGAFLVSGIQKYESKLVKLHPRVEEQVKSSYAVEWNTRYKPAPRIWSSPPVKLFVEHVKRMGLNPPADKPTEPPPIQAASNAQPKLQVAAPDPSAPPLSELDPEVARAVEAIREELKKAAGTK